MNPESLLQGLEAPAVAIDRGGVLTACNSAAESLLGMPSSSLRGRPLHALLRRWPEATQLPPAKIVHCQLTTPAGLLRDIDAQTLLADAQSQQRVIALCDVSRRERTAACERLFGELYREASVRPDRGRLKGRLVHGLADYLHLPLVLIGRKEKGGHVSTIATSDETPLWADFQRLPERWDSEVMGNGPAATALRDRAPVALETTAPGFMPWRAAAERNGIRCALSWPLRLSADDGVLALFAPSTAAFAAEELREHVAALVERIERFLRDLSALREQHLLARALEAAGNPAFITDREGTIVWSNASFCGLYGYSPSEVRGRNPRFLASGRHGMRYYRDLWRTIRAGRVWSGETVDRDRNGVAYTVRQTISPVIVGDEISHFLAVHANITHMKDEQVRKDLRLSTDERTVLFTRPAFEAACREAMEQAGDGFTLALVSTRDFQRAVNGLGEETEAASWLAIGERIRAVLQPPHRASMFAPGEYALLLFESNGSVEALLQQLRNALRQPLPMPQAVPAIDFRSALARYPADGRTIDELYRYADRQLADQPHVRARRHLPRH